MHKRPAYPVGRVFHVVFAVSQTFLGNNVQYQYTQKSMGVCVCSSIILERLEQFQPNVIHI